MITFLELLAVLFIVLGNAFFVAAEYALVTARRSRLVQMGDEGNMRAKIALRIMDSPVRFIGTVQLGITAFSILLGAVGEPLVEHWFDEPLLSTAIAFAIAYTFVTYMHVTLGELVPKAIALDRKEATALWVALPIEAVYIASYPSRSRLSTSRRIRSSGSCNSPPTRSLGSSGSSRRPRGSSPTRRKTSA